MPDSSRRSAADAAPLQAHTEPEISIVALAGTILRRRWLVLGTALVVTTLITAIALLSPDKYTVTSSFIVQNNDQSAAASLAAKIGMDVGGVDPSQSPQFYVEMIRSPVVLQRIADMPFRTSTDSTPRSLAAIFNIKEPSAAKRRLLVLKRLSLAVNASLGLKLDLVSLNVVTGDPLLSQSLAQTVLNEINRFNLETRQSRATKERQFTERRMAELRDELRENEGVLQRFYERNRQQYLSAERDIEKNRIGRKVELLQATYSSLAQSYERARIDEVRDTPVITIIQRPETPVMPDSRRLVSRVILGLFLGMLLGVVLAFAKEALDNIRASRRIATSLPHVLGDAAGDPHLAPVVPGYTRQPSVHS